MTTRKFEGQPVTASALKVSGTGDGLSKAMAIDSDNIELFDDVTVVVRGTVVNIDHKPIETDNPDAGVRRIPEVKAHSMTILTDTGAVDAALAAQVEAGRVARDRARGQGTVQDAIEAAEAAAEASMHPDEVVVPDDPSSIIEN